MSSYLCSDLTFASISTTLKVIICGGRQINSIIAHSLVHYGLGLGDVSRNKEFSTSYLDSCIDSFVAEIYEDNEKAVGDVKQFPFNDKDGLYLTDIQVFKCLQCVLYQCAAGDKTSTAYMTLNNLVASLAIYFISKSEEYLNAPWGID